MKLRVLIVAAFLLAGACAQGLAANAEVEALLEQDAEGAADSALTGRYEGSYIVGQTQKAFDEITLPNGPATGEDYADDKQFTSTVTLQGKVTRSLYVSPRGRSSLEVLASFKEALAGKGFTEVFACSGPSCGPSFKVLKYKWDNEATLVISEGADNLRRSVSQAMFDAVSDVRYSLLKSGEAGQESYVALFAAQNQNGSYGDVSEALNDRVGVLVETLEPKAREQKIVTLSAGEIGSEILNDGKAVIYGIYFDFDKAAIKPESQEQLGQIVEFLNDAQDSSFYVVGHTDNQGKLDYNLKLSQARATAVAKALASLGIDAKRLVAKGVGPLAPQATNANDEGRALNRRVELVPQ